MFVEKKLVNVEAWRKQKFADETLDSVVAKIRERLFGDFPLARIPTVAENLSAILTRWRRKCKFTLIGEYPFSGYEKELQAAEWDYQQNVATISAMEKALAGYRRLASGLNKTIHADKEYWERNLGLFRAEEQNKMSVFGKKSNQLSALQAAAKTSSPSLGEMIAQKQKESEISAVVADAKSQGVKPEKTSREAYHRLLLKNWRKMLDEARAEWEAEKIENWRRELSQELENWLRLLQEMQKTVERLGLDPAMLFDDFSKGRLSLDDIEALKRWAEIVNTPEVRKLCDMLGRLRRATETKKWKKVTSKTNIAETLPDVNSKEEIVGVYLGRDIERALPQEKALLADDDTALLFGLKYAENRLLCFDMQGWHSVNKEKEKETTEEVSEEDKMGPIMICVDTSGSMRGEPETIAKAIAMFMSTRAMAQKRRCYLINFSVGIETLDLSFDKGMSDLLQFIRRSFNGGTDPLPAIEAGVAMMQKEGYQKSDLLMVSDFVVSGEISQGLKKKIAKAREAKNKFYALAIGDFYAEQSRQEGVFDGEWSYDPRRGDIRKLAEIVVDGIAEQ